MPRLTVCYGHPSSTQEFDQYYRQVHAKLAAKVPGARDFNASRCTSLDENPPPFYLIAELEFDSLEALRTGLESAEGQAAAADLANFATGGATLFVQHSQGNDPIN